jgi:cytochrome c biogenesis factor
VFSLVQFESLLIVNNIIIVVVVIIIYLLPLPLPMGPAELQKTLEKKNKLK